MKRVSTYTANIYLGLRHGYGDDITSIDEVRSYVQTYCNEVRLGVTFTPTEFIYVDGNEPGVIIGLINYPRFPRFEYQIKATAEILANNLMKLCHQERVSIVFTDETIMLEKDGDE